ncbi:hypothetical protein DSO57_1002110 [Entomophthora muscae]|uniref:Uncharacterized protein n=1 Tax=Entomophthora muscae TaxID=34485 RepID=A0ACC2TWG0_9FUNG|nr:hypothetical protein DSO57_1002110 [Entomophthora muscae]
MEEYYITLIPFFIAVMLLIRRAFVKNDYLRLENVNSTESSFGGNSFSRDIEAGLTSSSFNTTQNLLDGDSRPGLDADDVKLIMEQERCSFDQARLIRQKRLMQKNNIDPDTGMPLDPKAPVF